MLVIAVGNTYRSDDGAGPELGARVRGLHLPGVTVVDALGDVSLIETWIGEDHVVLLDAVHSGAAPGTVIRLDLNQSRLPREWFHLSSHQVGVADAVELARALQRLPRRLVFVGIEGARFDDGLIMSPAVIYALGEAAAIVRLEAAAAVRNNTVPRASAPV